MKTTKSIIVVLFVLLTAQIAFAFYCPSTGRWLSRDPIGEPGFQTSQMASQITKPVQQHSDRWIERDPVTAQNTENLYVFVSNDSISKLDALGLYSICCCDAASIDKGRQKLIDAYNGVASAYQNAGIPPQGHGGSSCQTVNGYALAQMSPTPPCWTCILEHREKTYIIAPTWPAPMTVDHWVIVCQSHPAKGSLQEISFDYWESRPAGESPNHFRNEYPTPASGSLHTSSTDCDGKQNGNAPFILFPTAQK